MKKVDHYNFFSLHIKISETTYYQRNKETKLNRAKDYCENNTEVLRDKARHKSSELSEEDKNIKRQYGRNRFKNISEEEKERLKKYQKNYREANKKL